MSEPYISVGTINGNVYLNKYLIKRLFQFILKYHKIEDILFCPHLTTSHYQKDVLNCLRSQNIRFVKRPNSSPNRPQVRPIEKYWTLCKKEYKKRSKDPKV